MQVQIRKASKADYAVVVRLHKELMQYHYDNSTIDKYFYDSKQPSSEKVVSTIMSDMRYMLYLCEIEGTAVGMCLIDTTIHVSGYRTPVICWLYVVKECRSQGIGRQLLWHSMRKVQAMYTDCKGFQIDVETWNERAVLLYESLGFKEFRKKLMLPLVVE